MRNARRSMVAALVVTASLGSFGLIQSVSVGAATAAPPRPFYGVAEGAKVTILDAAYDPAEVTVTAGQAVSWKNAGQQPHSVTAEDGSFDSGAQDPGKEWSQLFQNAGTFAYKCTQNPAMKGTVKVNPPQDPTPK
jgi:plastocyanin